VAYFTHFADLPLLIDKFALTHYTTLSPMALAQGKATSGTAGGELFSAVMHGLEML
tara:strand:+ start:1149 stop:1316 length:168 start_codon:yes stop_codon:yes gene_type:complete